MANIASAAQGAEAGAQAVSTILRILNISEQDAKVEMFYDGVVGFSTAALASDVADVVSDVTQTDVFVAATEERRLAQCAEMQVVGADFDAVNDAINNVHGASGLAAAIEEVVNMTVTFCTSGSSPTLTVNVVTQDPVEVPEAALSAELAAQGFEGTSVSRIDSAASSTGTQIKTLASTTGFSEPATSSSSSDAASSLGTRPMTTTTPAVSETLGFSEPASSSSSDAASHLGTSTSTSATASRSSTATATSTHSTTTAMAASTAVGTSGSSSTTTSSLADAPEPTLPEDGNDAVVAAVVGIPSVLCIAGCCCFAVWSFIVKKALKGREEPDVLEEAGDAEQPDCEEFVENEYESPPQKPSVSDIEVHLPTLTNWEVERPEFVMPTARQPGWLCWGAGCGQEVSGPFEEYADDEEAASMPAV